MFESLENEVRAEIFQKVVTHIRKWHKYKNVHAFLMKRGFIIWLRCLTIFMKVAACSRSDWLLM